MEISVDTQSEAWIAAVRGLAPINPVSAAHESKFREGVVVTSPRGMRVSEYLTPTTIHVRNPGWGFVDAEGRTFNHAITAVEGLSLVGQTSVPELMTDRVKALAPYQDNAIFWGAYGPRAQGDVGQVVDLLRRDPDSRQAVISLYDSDRDLGRTDVKDVPCTISFQFRIRDGELLMWTAMRSNDAVLGCPYDLGQFSLLHRAVAQALDVFVGTYSHTVGSLHLYEKHWNVPEQISDPVVTPTGVLFGGSGEIGDTASRCRRMLLGHPIDNPTVMEEWLQSLLRAKETK